MDQATLEWSLYWAQAVSYQGKRVLEAEGIKAELTHSITVMEEQFMLNALGKALRWIGELKLLGVCVADIDAFLSVASISKLVRNKREHDDEYFGPQQKTETLSDASSPGSDLKISVGQSITVHKDGKVLLGGTVDVDEVINAAEEISEKLRIEQHQYLTGRFPGEPKALEHFFAPKGLLDS